MRNYKLDSLRGLAAAIVVFHHALHLSNNTVTEQVLLPRLAELSADQLAARLVMSVFSGGVAVYIFFILSGAVLMNSLQREERLDIGAAVRFTGRRVLRIYPAMIVAVIVFALASHVRLPAEVDAPFTLGEVVTNSLLLTHDVNGATWTLQSEMMMVPILLALALLQRLLGLAALVGYLIWAQTALHFGPPFGGFYLNVALMAFGLGALVPTSIARNAVERLPRGSLAGCVAGLVLARFYFPLNDGLGILAILCLGAIMVALLYHDSSPDHVLEHPAPRFLGRISYSLYLSHVLVVFSLFPVFRDLIGETTIADNHLRWGLLCGVIALLLTLPLAALSEIWFERPFIRLGHAIFPGRRGHPTGSGDRLSTAVAGQEAKPSVRPFSAESAERGGSASRVVQPTHNASG
ncbi:acyltransferase family protein [Arvimicrobium flavum]|uniref:acyltransferase family protein n=1 Tax=Arvimicrobium flavum TaxID=3393320 RepID=UPI00237A38C2|nr:acyltransferase [Mesorhizobium shangrilense]